METECTLVHSVFCKNIHSPDCRLWNFLLCKLSAMLPSIVILCTFPVILSEAKDLSFHHSEHREEAFPCHSERSEES